MHKFDVRGKIVLLLVFLVIFFLPIRLGHLAAYLAVLLVLSVLFLGFINTLRPIRMILPIIVLVLVLTPPFYRRGSVLLAIRGVTVLSTTGVLLALRLIIRFTGITVVFFLFIGTTDPDNLILAFRWFGLPFSVSLVLGIALEYIPTIRGIYDQVRDAHRLRLAEEDENRASVGGAAAGPVHNRTVKGPSGGPGDRSAVRRRKGLIKRLKQAIPTMTSVLILSVRRIPTLAMALECRGVGRKNRRSSYHSLGTGGALIRDGMITTLFAGLLIASLLLFY